RSRKRVARCRASTRCGRGRLDACPDGRSHRITERRRHRGGRLLRSRAPAPHSPGPSPVTGSGLNALPDPVVHRAAVPRIIDANDAAGRLVGRPREDLLGSSMADTFSPRGTGGEALLADGWHSSTRLRSVTAIPEHEVTIAGPDGDRM